MTDIPKSLKRWPGHTGNWGKWPNDRGSLNYITPEATLRGVQSVRQGIAVPCSRPITLEDPNDPDNVPAVHEMYPMLDPDRDNLLEVLESNGLTDGYGSFWNASSLTV